METRLVEEHGMLNLHLMHKLVLQTTEQLFTPFLHSESSRAADLRAAADQRKSDRKRYQSHGRTKSGCWLRPLFGI